MKAVCGLVLAVFSSLIGLGCSQRDAVTDAGLRTADSGTLPPTGDASISAYRSPAMRGAPGDVITEPQDEAATHVFDQASLRTYDLRIAEADLAAIAASPADEVYVNGMVEVDGVTYGPVGIRYKGSVGAFLAPCTSAFFPGQATGAKQGKCSIKVAFDHVDPEARFFGLRKLNFHSMNHDDSLLRDRLGYSLFRDMGIAAPRAVHARVLINGELEGLFAVVEQVDGRFTRSRFSEGGEGNLYKEIWPLHDSEAAYLGALETNEDEMPNVETMVSFAQAVATGADETLDWIDRDYTMRYVAVDRVMINDDGLFHFWCAVGGQGNNPGGIGNHNYYWYEAAGANRFWLVPWDLDSSFDASAFVHVEPQWTQPGPCVCANDLAQLPPSCDPLISHFKTWLEDYDAQVSAFLEGPFSEAAIEAKLSVWLPQIEAAVAEAAGRGGAPTTQQWQSAVQALRSKIASARQHRGYAY